LKQIWQNRRSHCEERRSLADHRTPYERDRTRLIHSSAFRRLQRKTQILGTREGDFHRTRLTHSLEVDSIARSIVRNLRYQFEASKPHWLAYLPEEDLIAAIALSHDIGHPPFGHGGEAALHDCMKDYGGFESNGQTLRLLTKLETSHAPFGLDLTRRTLLGILKYPAPYSSFSLQSLSKLPPKCYLDDEQSEVDWIFEALTPEDKILFGSKQDNKTLYHSFDCSIMNIADDIAYGVHDMEDAIHLGLISRDRWEDWEENLKTEKLETLWQQAELPEFHTFLKEIFHQDTAMRKKAISSLVNMFITSISIHEADNHFSEPLLRYNAQLPAATLAILEYCKIFVFDTVINSLDARTVEHSGQVVITHLFDAFSKSPEKLLSDDFRQRYQQIGMRAVCDYIASMTDGTAYDRYRRLFGFLD